MMFFRNLAMETKQLTKSQKISFALAGVYIISLSTFTAYKTQKDFRLLSTNGGSFCYFPRRGFGVLPKEFLQQPQSPSKRK